MNNFSIIKLLKLSTILAFLIILIDSWSWISVDRNTKTWPETNGEIIERNIKYDYSSSSYRRRLSSRDYLKDIYKYEVNGQEYTGKFYVQDMSLFLNDDTLNKYAKKNKIKVRYDPVNPSVSHVLLLGNYVYLGNFFITCVIIFVILNLFDKRK